MVRFGELDRDGNGCLDPAELFPVLAELSEAHPFSINAEQCIEFTSIFDTDRNGVISREEFVDYARFMIIMAFLSSPEGARVNVIVQGSKEAHALLRDIESDKSKIKEILPLL